MTLLLSIKRPALSLSESWKDLFVQPALPYESRTSSTKLLKHPIPTARFVECLFHPQPLALVHPAFVMRRVLHRKALSEATALLHQELPAPLQQRSLKPTKRFKKMLDLSTALYRSHVLYYTCQKIIERERKKENRCSSSPIDTLFQLRTW